MHGRKDGMQYVEIMRIRRTDIVDSACLSVMLFCCCFLIKCIDLGLFVFYG